MQSISGWCSRIVHVAILLLYLVGSSAAAAAAAQESLAGHWEGTITLPSGSLSLSADFAVAADGKLSGTVSIPQQGAKDLPLSNLTLNGAEVAFDIPSVPGEPKFRGRLSADGQK